MKTILIAFGVLAIVASGAVQEAAAQKGELDVTMRVLDDVRDIDAVIVAINAPEETAARDDSKKGARAERAKGETAAHDADGKSRADASSDSDALDRKNEDQVENALEDRDVAEDREAAPVVPAN